MAGPDLVAALSPLYKATKSSVLSALSSAMRAFSLSVNTISDFSGVTAGTNIVPGAIVPKSSLAATSPVPSLPLALSRRCKLTKAAARIAFITRSSMALSILALTCLATEDSDICLLNCWVPNISNRPDLLSPASTILSSNADPALMTYPPGSDNQAFPFSAPFFRDPSNIESGAAS